MVLADWIEAHHLTTEATAAYCKELDLPGVRAAVIDGFLIGERLRQLSHLFTRDGCFKPVFALFNGADEHVDVETYWAASESDRFFAYDALCGPVPGHELGEGWLAHLLFRSLTTSEEWLTWISAIAGGRLQGRIEILPRIMRKGMVLRPHDDIDNGQVCAVLYLSPGWSAQFGGTFVQFDHSESIAEVSPLQNRLVVFRPMVGRAHGVSAFTDAIGEWERWSYSLWYSTEPVAENGARSTVHRH